jgi:DGQHR domain-containing protein
MHTDEARDSFSVKCIKIVQPLGDFYIASMSSNQLVEITEFDVRRIMMEDREVERYLGIQRPLDLKRVKQIAKYVDSPDACFPTGVIVAIQGDCIEINDDETELTISNVVPEKEGDLQILYRQIAKVLDGQHRLEGLRLAALNGYTETFEINVSIFVDADIADQANIFSTVNLAQTKVNKSLAYDLFDVMHTRSPQKTCHNIAVTLDKTEGSPFYKKIKRLGIATPGRSNEMMTQAAIVEPLLRLISSDPPEDRRTYLKNSEPDKVTSPELLARHPLQHLFVDEEDFKITDIIWDYFSVVQDKWPEIWNTNERGVVLNRTNGYRALIRFLTYLFAEGELRRC